MSKPQSKIKVLTSASGGNNSLDIVYADIYSFDFLPDNIKTHDLDGIKESIRQFGFVEPILVNSVTNRDISGNGRLTCLRAMLEDDEDCPKGIIEKVNDIKSMKDANKTVDVSVKWFAPVVLLEMTEDEETVLAIKLNRTNEKGGIDNQKAYRVLKELREKNNQLFLFTGYDNSALEHIQMLAKFRDKLDTVNQNKQNNQDAPEANTEAEIDDLASRLNEKWQVKSGDIFQIGKHRLICGDSKKLEVYQNLFLDNKIRLVVTSPPYDNQRDYELSEKLDWTMLMNSVSENLSKLLEAPADILINLGMIYKAGEVSWYWNDWLMFCKAKLTNPVYGLYVWDQLTGMPGDYKGRLARSFELLFHFNLGRESANKWIETKFKTEGQFRDSTKRFRNKNGQIPTKTSIDTFGNDYKIPDNVIRLQRETNRGIHTQGHPATFPVHLPAFIIKTYSNIGDNICDPFLGSGSTMIAAQELDRNCFGIEISPNYCALILERMQLEFADMEIKKI